MGVCYGAQLLAQQAGGESAALVRMMGLESILWLLMTGELRVDADEVERAGQDRDDDRAGGRAAHLLVEIIPLSRGDKPDDQPDHQDHRP